MAQFFTNFDEYPVGDVTTSGQTDWSVKIANGTSDFRIIDGGDQDGKFLRINAASTNGSRVLAYNPVNGVSDNIETLVKFWIFKSGSDGSTGRYGASYIRYGGTTEAGTIGYAVSFVPVSSVKSLVLYEDSTGVVQYTNMAWSMSTDYFIRTRLSGTTRQVKIWAASSAEPGSWTFSSTATPPTIASPYSGVGTYQADSYLYVKQFSVGTGGDTAPMYATTDKTQTGQFRVTVPPPSSAPADGYSGGYGGVAGYSQGYATGFYPTATTNDKDQIGVFRVKQTYDKPQIGIFRVRRTYDNTQIGKFRIRQTYDNPQVGLFRIASEPFRVQVGKFRVRVAVDRPQVGKFTVATPTNKDQIGKFRVRRTYDTTQVGRFRVTASADRNQVGKFRVIKLSDQSQTGKFRVQVTLSKTQVGRFLVRKTNDKPQVGQFRIEYLGVKHQVGKFRIYDENTLPEVFVEVDRYKETNNSYGTLEASTPESGRINESSSYQVGDIEQGTVDTGNFNFGVNGSGIIRSNNDYTILMFEDNFIWLSEDEGFIIVQEFNKDDIINMISTEGKFTAGKIDNGTIQEAL